MNVSGLLAGYGAARVGAGAVLAAAPAPAARRWLGPPADQPAVRVAVRLLGVRDLLLGAATMTAAHQRRDATGWAVIGAAADAADVVITVANRSRLPRSALAVAALAAAGTSTGLALALAARSR